MTKLTFTGLLAAGLMSLALVGCGGNDPDYGTRAPAAFIPGAGIAPPRFAYVVNQTSNNVSGFTVNPTTGLLTPITDAGASSPWATGLAPTSMSVDAGVQFAYVVNSGSDNISTFTIGATGALTSTGGALVATGVAPVGIAVDPLGRYVYVVNSGDNTISAYARNSTSGLLSPLSPATISTGGINPQSIAIDPSGKFVYVANFGNSPSSGNGSVSVFSIDTASATAGQLIPVGTPIMANVNAPQSVAISPSGAYAYVANYGDDSVSVFDINATTGGLTVKSAVMRAGTTPTSVAVEPNGKFAYVANLSPGMNSNRGDVGAYTIAQSGSAMLRGSLTALSGTGAVSVLSSTGSAPYSVSADPSGTYVYAVQSSGGVINPFKIGATGVLTPLTAVTAQAGTSGSIFILITK